MRDIDPAPPIAGSWTRGDVAATLLRAAGHAACYGAVVGLIEASSADNNFEIVGPPAMTFAFLIWLLIVGRRTPSILRLAATGYATVASAALAVLFSFGAGVEPTLRTGVMILPLILFVTGTAAAILSTAYGLALRIGRRRSARRN